MFELFEQSKHTWPNSNGGKVVCADARSFLSQCPDESFDVVIAAGVLHCFHDPINILSEICRVSKESVLIEAVYPDYSRSGFLQEYTSTFESLKSYFIAMWE